MENMWFEFTDCFLFECGGGMVEVGGNESLSPGLKT